MKQSLTARAVAVFSATALLAVPALGALANETKPDATVAATIEAANPRAFDAITGGFADVLDAELSATGVGRDSISLAPDYSANATVEDIGNGVDGVRNDNGSVIVPVEKTDGSVAVNIVIEDSNAPADYRFDLGLPTGATLNVQPTGAIVIVDSDGVFLGGVSAPWARDAAGRSLDTHYKVDGSVLVQTVVHNDSLADYPVVADPWIGVALIGSWKWAPYRSGEKLSVNPTLWARSLVPAQLPAWAGWDELITKTPKANLSKWRITLQGQYICHGTGGVIEPVWDLETTRPVVSTWTMLTKLCNS
ncbi:MAG: DUF2599 domain-containing protein [Cryobacterium sp.]|nr:DUF2599 domain-containing protein [Cryobacterium sp.]